MKASELKGQSADDLQKQMHELLEQQFRLRTQKVTGQLRQTHLLKQNQRDIARIKTVLNSL